MKKLLLLLIILIFSLNVNAQINIDELNGQVYQFYDPDGKPVKPWGDRDNQFYLFIKKGGNHGKMIGGHGSLPIEIFQLIEEGLSSKRLTDATFTIKGNNLIIHGVHKDTLAVFNLSTKTFLIEGLGTMRLCDKLNIYKVNINDF